ncbi:hypothetical protein [Ferroplasma sp.]|uniref:hypothetical protein n=1 Tax=Ferroplasma sp. TaxID=2591003 RepID=UPI00307F2BEA
MNSNNATMHKFGIENSCIATAINTMLGKTNNTVKSINISETNAAIIDFNWNCIIAEVAFGASIFGLIGGVAVLNATPAGWVFDVGLALVITSAIGTIAGFTGMDSACNWEVPNPWW